MSRCRFRFPADIKWWDRNRFVLSVEDDVQNGADSDNDEENDTEEDEYQDELFKAISAAIDKIQLPEFEVTLLLFDESLIKPRALLPN